MASACPSSAPSPPPTPPRSPSPRARACRWPGRRGHVPPVSLLAQGNPAAAPSSQRQREGAGEFPVVRSRCPFCWTPLLSFELTVNSPHQGAGVILAGEVPPTPSTTTDADGDGDDAAELAGRARCGLADHHRAGGLPARAGAGGVDAHRGAVAGAVGRCCAPGGLRRTTAEARPADIIEVAVRRRRRRCPPIGALGWMHRQAGHPAVGDALGAEESLRVVGAQQIFDWSRQAARGCPRRRGCRLAGAAGRRRRASDLGRLAEAIHRQCARVPDTDGDAAASPGGQLRWTRPSRVPGS